MSKKLTIAEIAAREGIPKRTVLYAARTGALKTTQRVGLQGIYLVTEHDLEAWLESRRVDELPVYVKE